MAAVPAVPTWGRLLMLGVVVLSSVASEELWLEQPPRPPRVYAAAPSGVDVTVLRAVNLLPGADTHIKDPRFSLHRSNKTDHQYFTIDESTGVIKTARYLERQAGHHYFVIAVVLESGLAGKRDLNITVTHFNQFDPVLGLQHYSAEVAATAGTGTRLLTVTATDRDSVDYNRAIHFFLADPSETPFTLNPFLDPPAWSPVRIDPITGVLRVARPLHLTPSSLQLLVGAVDGGSPQRYSLANLTVYIRDMPAPRSVVITNTSESSLTVCWSPPALGNPEGYILSYIPAGSLGNPGDGFLNLTIEQLHQKLPGWSNDQEAPIRGDSLVQVYRYCAVVGGLLRWTEYAVGVRAWAGQELSVAAAPVKATTTSNYCAEGVCKVGNCSLQQDPPGYSCKCPANYYGDKCQHHNPCLPVSPCSHLGLCHNHTDGSYTCECLYGFYGPNCTLLNPCAAVATNPCTNGGSCISERSGQYECVCPEGFYGLLCEDRDPCHSKPCLHGGSCTNLTQTTFSCVCPAGYTGKKCEMEVNECDPSPCRRGECTDLLNDYHCQCPRGWGGKKCDVDLESCPAQTTLQSTGEFHWPATHHGESVTISCPYGVLIPATEDRDTTETTPFPQMPPTLPTNEDDGLEYEAALSSTGNPQMSKMTTTFAEWEGGSFQIKRKSRDVYPSHSTLFDEHEIFQSHPTQRSLEERKRLILSSLRGWRKSERHSHGQSRKGQVRRGRERQNRQSFMSDSSRENEKTPRTHLHDGTQTNSNVEEQDQNVRKQTEGEQGTYRDLKIGTDVPENLTLQMGMKADLKDQKKKNASEIHEKSEHLQVKRSKLDGQDENLANIDLSPTTEIYLRKAVRSCILLPNGNVTWKEPDTSMCREEAMQKAERAAEEVANLTAFPSAVDSEMFTRAADQLAMIVDHAVKDPAVASKMVESLSNMMEVNDSVVAAVDQESSVTKQILKTINTFTENVALEVGKHVKYGSQHLIIEARLLDSSLKENITFSPTQEGSDPSPSHSSHVPNNDIDLSVPSQKSKPYISLPPQALKLAGTKNVRLEFVSFANDKFFRSQQGSGLPVIAAKITNTEVTNLSYPVLYHIPLAASHTSELVHPVCVFWDEKEQEWSSDGLNMVQSDGKMFCQASHLTAFSILLDPVPEHHGLHARTLSIITYIGLIISTGALIATVATYALFRTLNRDRSGKIVMNLSLVLLLLNIVFIIAANLKPPSVACMALAATLHYLVVAAFAWMLVEAANMYQLLITVFASAETHFMAKRVVTAWGIPVVLVVIALAIDKDVYGDPAHGHCVISPMSNPALYYSTYLGPICLVLLVNCVVFVLVTRVLCQRRPRSNKPRATSSSPPVELPITLAQVRGAVTVVALLGITWVAGALSIGGVRVTLQYLFCLTTPLQGLIIFIVRVAQNTEARASWIALLTTGTLRRRPPTHTRSTHSSDHSHSTLSTTNTPRNNHSSTHTTSTRISLRTSAKPTANNQRNGSIKSWKAKNGSISSYSSKNEKGHETNSVMSTIFAHLVMRFSNGPHENGNDGPPISKNISKVRPDSASVNLPELECPSRLNQEQSYFCEAIPEKSRRSSHKNKAMHRPQSLVLLRTDSHGSVMATQSSTLSSQDCINPQFPLLSSNFLPEELMEVGIPSSLVPRRSLGSLVLTAGSKEGDDSSWHFVRPPTDGHSNPVSEGESILVETDHSAVSTKGERDCEKLGSKIMEASESKSHNGCIVLSGQRVATNNSAISVGGGKIVAPNLTRANSEVHVNSSLINPADLRRSASVYTLGEWEDPRSSIV
ncbi:hypothetical protein O3P69_004065 [Scylla paramamosain]|uniref:Uncharacterized protein n=1 Tax=Scylla paramamosain TaxID=85552 RepID=A0AAW0UEW9_SCYPA